MEKDEKTITNQHQSMKCKYSYGLICCRYNNEKKYMEVLLIQKRISYSYYDFIMGNYKMNDLIKLKKMFDNMTNDEKLTILTLSFSNIWYRAFLKKYDNIQCDIKLLIDQYYSIDDLKAMDTYSKKKMRFDKFTTKYRKNIINIIKDSKSLNQIWEIPKGRKHFNDDNDLNTSLREFYEETQIEKNDIKILFDIPIKKELFINMNVKYQNIYYTALYNKNDDIKLNFNSYNQLLEVSDIKWMSLAEIKIIDQYDRICDVVSPIFKKIKKIYAPQVYHC